MELRGNTVVSLSGKAEKHEPSRPKPRAESLGANSRRIIGRVTRSADQVSIALVCMNLTIYFCPTQSKKNG